MTISLIVTFASNIVTDFLSITFVVQMLITEMYLIGMNLLQDLQEIITRYTIFFGFSIHFCNLLLLVSYIL